MTRIKFITFTLCIVFFAGVSGAGFSTNEKLSQEKAEYEGYHPFKSAEAKEKFLKVYDQKAKDWPVRSTTRMIKTDYGMTFVRISGPETAPPLVLLHGVGGNSLIWIPNIKELSEKYRTYAVDMIDGGGRSIPTRPTQTAGHLTDWLDQLFSELQLEDGINLVGLSYGGWVTSQYALRFPRRLSRIVMLAPAGTVLPLSNDWIQRAMRLVQPEKENIRDFFCWLMEDLAKKDDLSRQTLDALVEDAYLSIQSFKMTPPVNPVVLTDEQWQSIEVPALFLVGRNEKIYSASEAVERLNRIAPQIKTKIIPDAGHDLTLVQAKMVDQIILEFLKLNPIS
ncbi:MAG: alpha/beta hydrolase [Candidatus Aminicenantales bacterium]